MLKTAQKIAEDLYLSDETAWLEEMASLASQGRVDELDCEHLAEYLTDMSTRDRREVESRLAVLIAHRLKWEHQPAKRARSWLRTMKLQRQELRKLFTSKTLRNHAEKALAEAYRDATELAAVETGLPESTFPAECPYTLAQLESEPKAIDLPDLSGG
jgi:hypothetical protein